MPTATQARIMRPKRGAGREQAGDLFVATRSHCVCEARDDTRREACIRAITYGRYYGPEGYGRYYDPEGYDCYYGPEGYGPDPIQPIRHHDPEDYDHYYGPEDYDQLRGPEVYDHYYDPEDYDHYGASDDHWHTVSTQPKHDLRIRRQYGFQAVRPQEWRRPQRRHKLFNKLWGDRYIRQQLIRPMFR